MLNLYVFEFYATSTHIYNSHQFLHVKIYIHMYSRAYIRGCQQQVTTGKWSWPPLAREHQDGVLPTKPSCIQDGKRKRGQSRHEWTKAKSLLSFLSTQIGNKYVEKEELRSSITDETQGKKRRFTKKFQNDAVLGTNAWKEKTSKEVWEVQVHHIESNESWIEQILQRSQGDWHHSRQTIHQSKQAISWTSQRKQKRRKRPGSAQANDHREWQWKAVSILWI